MQRTVIGVFSNESEAERAVRALRDSGFTEQEISLIAKDRGQGKTGGGRGGGGTGKDTQTSMRQDNIGDGVTSGAAWGGLAGLALGAGAIAIPGLGPIVAAGPIAAALTGAATGGLAGGLLDWGIPETRGRQLQEEVRQGKILAVLRCSDSKVDRASTILRENGARDVESHSATARK